MANRISDETREKVFSRFKELKGNISLEKLGEEFVVSRTFVSKVIDENLAKDHRRSKTTNQNQV